MIAFLVFGAVVGLILFMGWLDHKKIMKQNEQIEQYWDKASPELRKSQEKQWS